MPQNWSVKSVLQTLRQSFYILGYAVARLIERPVPGRVLFLSDSHSQLVGNQLALAQELTRRGYDVRSVLKNGLRARRSFPTMVALCRLMATSPVIIVDDFYPMIYQIKLRKGTQLLQVWHASGAFKTMGFSRVGKPGGPIKGSKTHKNYTAAIVSSPSIRTNYAEAFSLPLEHIHATGIPRTDVFFDQELVSHTAQQIRAELDIPEGKKLLVFAPTFRGNGQLTAYYDYSLIDWQDLAEHIGTEYIIGIKPHPFVSGLPELTQTDSRLRDLSGIADTNALLMAADLLVTDYSSIIFDFALLHRPTIFFCPDLEEYVAARDFYYPYEKYTFGPLARTHKELVDAITHAAKPDGTANEFLDFFCASCDGNATARVIDQLIAPYAGEPAPRAKQS